MSRPTAVAPAPQQTGQQQVYGPPQLAPPQVQSTAPSGMNILKAAANLFLGQPELPMPAEGGLPPSNGVNTELDELAEVAASAQPTSASAFSSQDMEMDPEDEPEDDSSGEEESSLSASSSSSLARQSKPHRFTKRSDLVVVKRKDGSQFKRRKRGVNYDHTYRCPGTKRGGLPCNRMKYQAERDGPWVPRVTSKTRTRTWRQVDVENPDTGEVDTLFWCRACADAHSKREKRAVDPEYQRRKRERATERKRKREAKRRKKQQQQQQPPSSPVEDAALPPLPPIPIAWDVPGLAPIGNFDEALFDFNN